MKTGSLYGFIHRPDPRHSGGLQAKRFRAEFGGIQNGTPGHANVFRPAQRSMQKKACKNGVFLLL
jgi:hypothetical protein